MMHTHAHACRYVKPAYEKMMDQVHSREEVLKAADDALAQVKHTKYMLVFCEYLLVFY